MRILAIDPGTTESAYVAWRGDRIAYMAISPNQHVRDMLALCSEASYDIIAIEMIACYGMAVGKETFESCLWIGRFCERAAIEPRLIYRRDVKLHHCGSVKAKDANIRQAIVDRFGGKEQAIGRKATPGPLYGVKSHAWSALAIALFVNDTA